MQSLTQDKHDKFLSMRSRAGGEIDENFLLTKISMDTVYTTYTFLKVSR